MREFADILYTLTQPDRLAKRLWEAALFDAQGGLLVADESELEAFARAEAENTHIEQLLQLAPTEPAALMTDEEIFAKVEEKLASMGGFDTVIRDRYREIYGDVPPVRRAGPTCP